MQININIYIVTNYKNKRKKEIILKIKKEKILELRASNKECTSNIKLDRYLWITVI